MAREWSGIDALRMDKFLYLMRCYVREGFERVSKDQWADEELLGGYLKILDAVPLNATNGKIPNGMRFHVIELYVDELDKVDNTRTAPLEAVLEPLRKLGRESTVKVVRERVAEALKDERLLDWQNVRSDESGDDEVVDDEQREIPAVGDDGSDDDDEFGGFGD